MNKYLANDSHFIRACGGGTVGYCVAVAIDREEGLVGVRDTKDNHKHTLVFNNEEWQRFIAAVKAGEFDVQQ
ncbi:DUF397 domain-containing protein [Endozoicomonas sp.]|uniref:DUF397 domain-containing protein n=1 Tax=Endozoicomonas sp. TaxID=1892382 RepID=UPI003AF9BAFC